MNVTLSDHAVFLAFWLSFSRWAAVLFQLPLFDNVAVPMLVKQEPLLSASIAQSGVEHNRESFTGKRNTAFCD